MKIREVGDLASHWWTVLPCCCSFRLQFEVSWRFSFQFGVLCSRVVVDWSIGCVEEKRLESGGD